MIRSWLARSDRTTLAAYGIWAMLSGLLLGGALGSLGQIERAETHGVLTRAEARSAALEATVLRVFEYLHQLQELAERRGELLLAGDAPGAAALGEQLTQSVSRHRFGIGEVSIVRANGEVAWSSSDPAPAPAPVAVPAPAPAASARHPRHHHQPEPVPAPVIAAAPAPARHLALEPGALDGLLIGRPILAGRSWLSQVSLPVAVPGDPPIRPEVPRAPAAAVSAGLDGAPTADHGDAQPLPAPPDRRAALVVMLDPLTLSGMMSQQAAAAPGEVSAVQRLGDGAFLARSTGAAAAFAERPSSEDPVLIAARRGGGGGTLHDVTGSVDRLVGYRVPPGVPLLVSQTYDTDVALGEFHRLRRMVLLIVGLLSLGALAGTRLLLAHVLLRRRLAEQAMHDPLTGLHNRRYFTDVMGRKLTAATRDGFTAAVLLIDLDGFKHVNDTRGHAVGDALLREASMRLLACAGEDDAVMRLGGDEFALVRLGRQQKRDATSLARYVVAELGRVYEIEGYHLRVGASVGVALPPDAGEELGELLRSADTALYAVKADGGGGYQLFDPAMEASVRARRALEMDLREALSRQELEVFYQPLVQLEPRRVCGFEALVRWNHPVHGMVLPSRFIPMAEETGLIAGIGQWVMRQACLEAMRWPPDTRINVNLSPVQFDRSDIVDVVASALRESRLDPSRLELEITEGVVMQDSGDVLATMRRLQALGVRLALDDFGTGYSSLSYLRAFPFDKVKIDASFLSDLRGDGGTIIRAVLGLCAHLKLDTLVEGVETEEQLAWLRAEGCTEAQGHLFSQPRPAAAIQGIMSRVLAEGTANTAKVVSMLKKF